MIITDLAGGLGNQMFQYTCGLSLSLDKKTNLVLRIDEVMGNQHNGFELNNAFNINNIATSADMREVLGIFANPWLFKKAHKRKWLRANNYLVEGQYNYDNSIVNIPDNAFISGYWQTEKYFIKHRNTILKAFTFNEKISAKNQEIISQIKQHTSVSVHIRRGDYLSGKAKLIHPTMNVEYYKKAIKTLNIKNDNILFVLFSDDISWVKENIVQLLDDAKYIIIDNNTGKESYNDMRLMSLCNHNIIANSSFSWWGAWLNINPNKKVIAPKNWFIVDDKNISDLRPKSWVLVSSRSQSPETVKRTNKQH